MALNVSGSDSLYWKTGINNAGLLAGSTQAKGILAGLSKSITRMDVFAGLAIGSALVFAKISKQAYNFSREFETAMKEVQTISKAVQNDFKGISQEIVDMSKTVPDSAQKLTKALYQIVSAGYDGAEAMDILKTSAELAVAGVTDTFTAADSLTYVMNAYGEAAGTASEISDKLFTIVKLGKVRMEELGPTLSMVTGLAAEAGMSFNDLGAFYAEAVKKIQPHIVSTGIRGFVTALLRASKEGSEAAKAAKEMGIEFDVATLKSKGLEYMLKQMSEATEGQKEKLMELFPNVRGLIGLLAIMTNEGMNFKESSDAITNSLGNNTKAFKTMMDTTENQLAILHNNLMAKLKPLGDSILGTMNSVAKGINIAMSGANDEMSRLSRSYSELADTLRNKQNRIDSLIATVEDLRGKTKLTREETTQLKAAEEALAVYYPTLGKAAEFAGESIDVLTLAKKGTIDETIKIMKLEQKQAEIEKRRADLELATYRKGEDEGNKEIKRLQNKVDLFRRTLSIQQIIELTNTGEIQEEIRLQNELSMAIEQGWLEQEQLNQNVEKTTEEYKILTEALEEFERTREKPIVIPDKGKSPDKTTTITTIVAINTEEVDAQLKYMASQYKLYLSDLTQHDKEWIKEHNAQLVIDGENYRQYLSDMRNEYKDNAELLKIIDADIYEYDKAVIEKRKQIEDELFAYIANAREQDLAAEKERFDNLNLEVGTIEYISAVEKYNNKVKEINLKYDKEIADAKLVIFKAVLEQQTGESDKVYKERYEKQLIAAKAEIGKETEINKVYFKFLYDELNKIAKAKEEQAKIDEATLASYLDNYRTTEEKIAAIHAETNNLIELTDDEITKNRLENIGKQKIAELEFADAMERLNEELAGYKKDLDNKGLENYIKFLEEMKLKYSDFADIIILLNEKIAESQKQIWENTRDEINQTIDLLHNLAGVVGKFDTELSLMINNVADLVDSIGQITFGFATSNIFGIIGGIISGIGAIFNLFTVHHSDVPELEEQLHEITLELQEQQNILSQSIGTAKVEAIQDMIDLLNEQITTYNEMIEAEQEAYGQFLWFTWSETDQDKIEQWLSSIQDINAEIANLNDQYNQILTGTTASAIAEAIAEGFSQGLDSAQIFADTFNEMMKKSILDAFKRTILTDYLQKWYRYFARLSEGGLTAEEIDELADKYLLTLQMAEVQWEAVLAVLASAGIEIGEAETIEEVIEQAEEAMEAIAGITEETIADSIAAGFSEGLDYTEVFADTFKDMMQRAIIDAFKKTIITQYLKNWYDQFNILSEGGFTVEEIKTLAGVYKNIINVASTQWEAMESILEAAGIGLELEEAKRTGLTGAIAGITEETAGILAGQFQAIRINTVEILGNMESIIIINSQIAENTSYNRHLESIDRKISEGNTLESEYLRAIGG